MGVNSSGAQDMKVLIRVVRGGFVVFMLVVMFLYIFGIQQNDESLEVNLAKNWWVPVAAALGLAGVFLAIDITTPRKKIATITGVIFGLVAGLIATWVVTNVIDLVVQSWDIGQGAIVSAIKVLLGVSLSFLGITTVLQTQDEFRLVIPYVEFAKQIRGPRPLLIDTSVLIDTRLVDIAATGLVQQTIVIPRFVLEELQTLADSSDRGKRVKGRRGLDMVGRLQRMGTLDVVIDTTPVQKQAVDQALVELAGALKAMLVTLDTGLSRVASAQSVPVLNINDMSNALRPSVIPGKTIRVEIVKAGEQEGQGVGYLEDGTMVVAEDGGAYIGQSRDLIITSSMQTAAGRLLFARVDMAEPDYEGPVPGDDPGGGASAAPQDGAPGDDGIDSDGPDGGAAPMDDADGDESSARGDGGPRPMGRPRARGSARNPRR